MGYENYIKTRAKALKDVPKTTVIGTVGKVC
jgi:hypothetical protein